MHVARAENDFVRAVNTLTSKPHKSNDIASIDWAENVIRVMHPAISHTEIKKDIWTGTRILEEYDEYVKVEHLFQAIVNHISKPFSSERENALNLLTLWCSAPFFGEGNWNEWNKVKKIIEIDLHALKDHDMISAQELQTIEDIYYKSLTGLAETRIYNPLEKFTNKRAIRRVNDKLTELFEGYPTFKEVLRPILKKIRSGKREKTTLSLSRKEERITSPTDTLLALQAEYYAKKYDIEIKIVRAIEQDDASDEIIAGNLLTLLQEQLQDLTTERTIGIIYSGLYCGHVVPLIFAVREGQPSALVLDVLGYLPGHPVHNEALSALKLTNIPFLSCKDERQNDIFSCRTGALVTLRNALLDLKNKGNPCLFAAVNVKNSHRGDQPKKQTFRLPASWGAAHDQRYRKTREKNWNENLPTRKYVGANKTAQSLRDFKEKNLENKSCAFQLEIALRTSESAALASLGQDCLPSGVTISKKVLKINWQEMEQQNGYMINKAERIYERALRELQEKAQMRSVPAAIQTSQNVLEWDIELLEIEILELENQIEELDLQKISMHSSPRKAKAIDLKIGSLQEQIAEKKQSLEKLST